MMELLLSLMMSIFLIPNFWLFQWYFFVSSFVFLLKIKLTWFSSISLFLGLDYFSFFLILLSYWICSLMIMASEKLYKVDYYYNFFLFIMILLMLSLFLAFSSLNLFIFYLFFEMSLIPTLILIVGWGYQPERIEAGMYLMFYTLFFSLPMMLGIFYFLSKSSSMLFMNISVCESLMIYFCINMMFMVKIPLYFLHLWLPKAHVEASVSGSMILAGIMLKLGGYGLIRLLKIFPYFWFNLNLIFIVISLVGGFFISMICLRQNDLKSLIAYSSVVHMGLAVGGLLTLNFWGLIGSFILMLAHGLCSSGLFCLANINYERLFSRSLYVNKGLLNIMPSLTLWWFLFSISNMAAPPSLNLMGEIFLINSLIIFNWMTFLFLILISFFSAVYSMYLYSFSQHGIFYSGLFSFQGGNFREYLLLFLHWLPLNFFVVKGDFMMF
uniref:NADH-ubiquinone oxidoreductase chain 4 n=1 Tax=Chrysochares punctatus TaxID=2741024 RepID=A0A890CGS1_9CUCU|nr:NADH deshydrogenase subunit 4 [Chrysochares punctatus]